MRPIRPCAASTSCAADLIVAAQASSVTPSNPMLPIVQARIRPLAVRDDLRSGIGGWSPGNQSAGPKPSAICCRVKPRVLLDRGIGWRSGIRM